MNRRSKQDRRRKKREAKAAARRIKRDDVATHTPSHGCACTPCPDSGARDGELCPRCAAREVKVHRCGTCGDAFLRCCACGYAPTVEEGDRIARACEERVSTVH
jgi:hypothetical protein